MLTGARININHSDQQLITIVDEAQDLCNQEEGGACPKVTSPNVGFGDGANLEQMMKNLKLNCAETNNTESYTEEAWMQYYN